MTPNIRRILAIAILALAMPFIAASQSEIKRLMLSGYKGSVPVKQIEGKDFVEIEALARLANGSVSFNGEQVTLTLATPSGETVGSEGAESKERFSREFLRAWIEEMSTIREWHSALATAVKSQSPIWQSWLGSYESRASTNLQLVQVSAVTDADRKAAPLVANEYQTMKQLSDKYVVQRASVSYIAPDSLASDPLDQSVSACGQALESMAASGQFLDTGSCR
jgi:hypothetical protein